MGKDRARCPSRHNRGKGGVVSVAKPVRGQPLVALLAVLAGWIGGRAAEWTAPSLTEAAVARTVDRDTASAAGFAWRVGPQSIPAAPYSGYGPAFATEGAPTPVAAMAVGDYVPARRWAHPGSDWRYGGQRGSRQYFIGPPELAGFTIPAGTRSAATKGNGQSGDLAAASGSMPAAAAVAQVAVPRPRRWSMDSWAMLRGDGTGTPTVGALPAVYGASQTGAVLRYRLDTSSRRRPTVYVRSTSAIGSVPENTMAAGLSGRVLPSLPVVAAIEARLADQPGGNRFQPAAVVYSELPPLALPGRMQAEAYLQGGFVGGRFATPFADGQVRVDRPLLRLGQIQTRLGGGIWGGMQRGAARLDAGPGAQASVPLGRGMFGRLAVDWRFRVAGDATPGSGPVVTLSAGF